MFPTHLLMEPDLAYICVAYYESLHNNTVHITQGLTLLRQINWMKSAEMRSLVVIKISIALRAVPCACSAFPKFVMHKAFRILHSNHFAFPVIHNILLVFEANSELFVAHETDELK